MVAKVPLLSNGDGGIYFISPSQDASIRKWKVGMSHNSILKRINSYGICYTQVHVACIIKVKRQQSKAKPSYARIIEKFIHEVLTRMGYHQDYATLTEKDGTSFNFVTRGKGEFYGELTRETVNVIVQAIWPWLEQLGGTVAYDPQSIVDYDDEGAIVKIKSQKPIILDAIIPNVKPIEARILLNTDPVVIAQNALKIPKKRPADVIPTNRRSKRTRKTPSRLKGFVDDSKEDF
jgi:hypothetical protein